jgi:hypothetical protein
MLTWSRPNAIVPDEPLPWILTSLRFYAIVASVGIALAFAVISILAVLHHKGVMQPIGTGQIDRIEGGGGTMVVLIALILLFAAATYFTGRSYGQEGYSIYSAMFVIIFAGLLMLGLAFG